MLGILWISYVTVNLLFRKNRLSYLLIYIVHFSFLHYSLSELYSHLKYSHCKKKTLLESDLDKGTQNQSSLGIELSDSPTQCLMLRATIEYIAL
jgi:hypothetical protein